MVFDLLNWSFYLDHKSKVFFLCGIECIKVEKNTFKSIEILLAAYQTFFLLKFFFYVLDT